MPTLPPGLSYVEVAAGNYYTVARRSDGSVVAWGNNSWGQRNVPALPPGFSYVEVAAGYAHLVARLSDGSVVAWGLNNQGSTVVPALPPGVSYAQVSAGGGYTVALVESGSFETFGPGCPGSLGVPTLTAASPPRVGQTVSVELQRLPQSQAIVFFGASNRFIGETFLLPVNLSFLGLTGCSLRVSPDVAVPVVGAGNSATLTFPVPAVPAFVGLVYYQQAIVPDPQSAAGLVMSDAATAVVGS